YITSDIYQCFLDLQRLVFLIGLYNGQLIGLLMAVIGFLMKRLNSLAAQIPILRGKKGIRGP
ncbi:MAG TPA: hypothetical protein VEL11_00815, partial [Candidatus Bathyarchaeia archaeon]|nr:hypothetical protein [Candidatus Bathyarchaeia archaeon]